MTFTFQSVNYGDGETQGYGFDAMGNRVTKSDTVSGGGTGSESYICDDANRLTSRTVGTATSTVTPDANGNTLADGTRSNTWDSENRLISCTSDVSGSTQTSAFTYGGDGLRRTSVATNGDGTSTHAANIYDGRRLVAECVMTPQ